MAGDKRDAALNVAILTHAFTIRKDISIFAKAKHGAHEKGKRINSIEDQDCVFFPEKTSPRGNSSLISLSKGDGDNGRKAKSLKGIRNVGRGDKPLIPERGFGRSPSLDKEKGEVSMCDVREECAMALGLPKNEMELYMLCHIPHCVERAKLYKDQVGFMHLGLAIKKSDLSLEAIEQLIQDKDKDKVERAAQDYNIIANEKIEECKELKAKSAGLQGEVDSLKIKLEHANNFRKAFEESIVKLRVELDKLLKDFFMVNEVACSNENTQTK